MSALCVAETKITITEKQKSPDDSVLQWDRHSAALDRTGLAGPCGRGRPSDGTGNEMKFETR